MSAHPARLSEISELPPLALAAASPSSGSSTTTIKAAADESGNTNNVSASKTFEEGTSPSKYVEKVVPHPKDEDDIEALRACWAPKVRESVAARLPGE